MTTYWSESWTGANGAAWPQEWFTGGQGAATIQGNRGRLTSGAGSYSSHRGRLLDMSVVRDVNLLLTFTFSAAGEKYLTVGTRTGSNDPAVTNESVAPRGMYLQIYDLFGAGMWLIRRGYDEGFNNLASTTSGIPALVAGTAYKLRFLIEGKRMRARVWAAASQEPGTWALDYTDPDAYVEPGKITIGYTTNSAGAVQYVDVDDLKVVTLDPVPVPIAEPVRRRQWTMWSRAADNSRDVALPIASIKLLKRHMGLRTAVVQTQYTPERWASVQASRGLLLYRNGVQEFSGPVVSRKQVWDAESGELRIRLEAAGDELHLADRTVFPDPLRAADDQTVNDYWMTRNGAGVATAKVASTAMMQLISDQAGPTCRADRRVTGLVLGADPAIGLSRIWSGLFNAEGENGVLDQLKAIANASGENLGLRVTSGVGSLTADVVEPRDLTQSVKFSADLRNLVGYEYEERAPTCTHALVAGQGDLHLRLRKLVVTASALASAWGRQVWKYLDRRDTADVAELTKEGTDATVEGDATVSLVVTLTDSEAASYGEAWDLGDAITIYVAPPRQGTSITVADVVREVLLEVDNRDVERITPAVGTPDATVRPTTREQQRLADIGSALGGLTRK